MTIEDEGFQGSHSERWHELLDLGRIARDSQLVKCPSGRWTKENLICIHCNEDFVTTGKCGAPRGETK